MPKTNNMIFKIGLNGVNISKEIPTGWRMVTFRQWVKLAQAGSDIPKMLSIFTGIEPETIAKAKIKNFEVLMSCFAFMRHPLSEILPQTCLGLKVPKSIEDEAAARYGDVQEIVNLFVKDDNIGNLNHYPLIAATYLLPSPYDSKEADKLAERLWDAPCQEVMAMGNFTLVLFNASRNGMLNTSHLEGTLRNRLRRGLVFWLNRLAFTIRYFTWKRQLPSSGRNYFNGLS